jgi:ribonuclease T
MPQLLTVSRGFLPVVVDLETGGFNSKTDAIIAACILCMDDFGRINC